MGFIVEADGQQGLRVLGGGELSVSLIFSRLVHAATHADRLPRR